MKILNQINLKEYSTFGIGGPAAYFAEVQSSDEMLQVLIHCRQNGLPFFILGKGSNCLFDDRGFNGMVILNKIAHLNRPAQGLFEAGAGYSFSRLGTVTAREGWAGLEFASGIPGTVGGAIFMNAGANGSETFGTLQWVDFISKEGEMSRLKKEELQFGYRTSSFHHREGAIVSAAFQLAPSKEAREKQIGIITYRKNTQPYSEKSAGCVFQNTPCEAAGALIDKCRLKGVKIGGAKVSEKHANFIINEADATSQEVLELIELVKQRVKEQTGIELQSEVRYIQYDV